MNIDVSKYSGMQVVSVLATAGIGDYSLKDGVLVASLKAFNAMKGAGMDVKLKFTPVTNACPNCSCELFDIVGPMIVSGIETYCKCCDDCGHMWEPE